MNNIFFPSKYPIVEAIMNPVSDLKLALAVADSGGYPSLFNDGNSEKLNFLLSEFKKSIGNTNIVVCTHIQSKDIIGFIKVIKKHKPSHCEIFCVDENGQKNNSILTDDKISRLNLEMINRISKTIVRLLEPQNLDLGVNAYAIKGKESAGLSGDYSVEELFKIQKSITTNKPIIPYGGIGTAAQVRNYINLGAEAVAIGTLFACAKESMLSKEVKEKLIKSSSENLTKSSLNQNELVFKHVDKISDWNGSEELSNSIRGDGKSGFIYAGMGIDFIKKERSVKEIIEYLVSEL